MAAPTYSNGTNLLNGVSLAAGNAVGKAVAPVVGQAYNAIFELPAAAPAAVAGLTAGTVEGPTDGVGEAPPATGVAEAGAPSSPPIPPKVYRGGSATPDNLTPRPGPDGDTTGLSTFDTLEAATPPGGKAQVIDTSKLQPPHVATPDAPPEGHVSIGPEDPDSIAEWAATRGTGQTHPHTQAIMDAIVDVVWRPK
jgi:hypothetical protein